MAVETGLGGPDDGKDKYGPIEGEQSEKDLPDLIGDLDQETQGFRVILEKFVAGEVEHGDLATILNHQISDKISPAWIRVIKQVASTYGIHSPEFSNAMAALWVEFENGNVEFLK